MKSPIFVYSEGYMDVFSSKEKAESYAEAIDVKNGIYAAAYDSEGNLFEFSVTPDNFVAIKPANPLVNKADEFYKLLQDFLKTLLERNKIKGISEDWIANASLSELVLKSLDFETH